MTNIKKIEQIDLNTGDIIKVWDSAIQAEQEAGFNSRRISQVCKGKSSKSGGYNWRYLNKTKEYGAQGPVEFKGADTSLKKECVLVSLDLKVLNSFDSIDSAAKYLNIKNSRSLLRKNRILKFSYINSNLIFDLEFFNNNQGEIKQKIEQYRNQNLNCKICENVYDSTRALATHIQVSHKIETRQYTIDHLYDGSIPTCKLCNQEPRYVSLSFKEYCKAHAKEAMKKGGIKGGTAQAWNKGKTKVPCSAW